MAGDTAGIVGQALEAMNAAFSPRNHNCHT